MKYVNLGRTGLKVSRICLGTMAYADGTKGAHPWALSEEVAQPFYKRAIEAGINFFDTANVYSAGTSEEFLGRAIKRYANRDEIVIATKVHGEMRANDPNGKGLSRKHVLGEIDASLKRLGTDYIDLYQLHWPNLIVPLDLFECGCVILPQLNRCRCRYGQNRGQRSQYDPKRHAPLGRRPNERRGSALLRPTHCRC